MTSRDNFELDVADVDAILKRSDINKVSLSVRKVEEK